MTLLANFNHFGAAHWETGSVRHILNYKGAKLSEALLLGITGGICVGYFTFAYKGVIHTLRCLRATRLTR